MTHKILDNGIVRELTTEEATLRDNEIAEFKNSEFDRALNNLRVNRNNLLLETDYLALSDNTMTEAMTNYRQELRDLTNGLTTVEEVEAVEYPTKPN
jgi:hypothetical protein|tara:strand:+ start:589 stop:879 length:291 start_codon:yes stop_codon:yes gene_type:complete